MGTVASATVVMAALMGAPAVAGATEGDSWISASDCLGQLLRVEVPAGVHKMQVQVGGGSGSASSGVWSGGGKTGGKGGSVDAVIAVTPGEAFAVRPGCSGTKPSGGNPALINVYLGGDGWRSGGSGTNGGGTGGGAAAVYRWGDEDAPVAIGGGGGGAGGGTCLGSNGWPGGDAGVGPVASWKGGYGPTGGAGAGNGDNGVNGRGSGGGQYSSVFYGLTGAGGSSGTSGWGGAGAGAGALGGIAGRYWGDGCNSMGGAGGGSSWVIDGASDVQFGTTSTPYARVRFISDPSAPAERSIVFRSSANGSLVTAENAGGGALIANRSTVGLWEQFVLVSNADGTVSLRAAVNNKYVVAENEGASSLIANRDSIGPWEKFSLVNNDDGTVSLKSLANNKYVSSGEGALTAISDSVGQNEKYVITYQ